MQTSRITNASSKAVERNWFAYITMYNLIRTGRDFPLGGEKYLDLSGMKAQLKSETKKRAYCQSSNKHIIKSLLIFLGLFIRTQRVRSDLQVFSKACHVFEPVKN